MFKIFWDFFIFGQIFLSPQVKRSVIISDKHGIYELPHELPNDLTLRILGNWKISGYSSQKKKNMTVRTISFLVTIF